jgi:hypothetical protein
MKQYQNKSWLYQKYWIDKLSLKEIEAIAGVSDTTIGKWMILNGIPRRHYFEAFTTKGKRLSLETRNKMSESQKKRTDNNYWLGKKQSKETCLKRSKSLTGKKRVPFTAEHRANIGKTKRGIKPSLETLRKRSLSMIGKNKGNENGMWNSGSSFLPYPTFWTIELREKIRERDNYQCQLCFKKENGRKHHIHHINFDKQDCNNKNLITLCPQCHADTIKNREYWQNYLQDLPIQLRAQ